jgi:adenylate cyclase
MAQPPDPVLESLDRHLLEESNAALAKGGLYSAVLGLLGGVGVLAIILAEAARNVWAPCIFAFFAGACSLVVWLFARRRRMRGPTLYLVFLPFVSLPTFFFLLSHLLMPAGAATYITGPISYLYFHLIVMTGFVFEPRLSITSGVVCGAGYFAMYLLGREHLAGLRGADPTLLQDLQSSAIFAMKAFMMAFGGFVVAALCGIARRLVVRVLHEEQQKTAVSRLFGQYVSEEVKEKILRDKAGTIGERKRVVVLFCDLRGFSTYSEGRDPEEIVRHLNEYFDAMVQAVTAEGGVVDKFVGDAIMAVFGGVLDLENPAASAVRAARRMRGALHELARRRRARGEPVFDNGIGMHWGEVLQGSIGSAGRKDFTVMGDAVNTASRLEGLTKSYAQKIVVTDALRGALPPELQALCVPLGRVTVKGKREELDIHGVPDPEPAA